MYVPFCKVLLNGRVDSSSAYGKARVVQIATRLKKLRPNNCNGLAMQNTVKKVIASHESENSPIRWSCRLSAIPFWMNNVMVCTFDV